MGQPKEPKDGGCRKQTLPSPSQGMEVQLRCHFSTSGELGYQNWTQLPQN